MKSPGWLLALIALVPAGPAGLRAQEETAVPSRVVAAGLFKNGLAAIRREVKLPGPGTYLVDDMPEPVHGTWWVESDVALETRTTAREVEEPLTAGWGVDFQKTLAGRRVTVHFRDGQIPPATGTVEALEEPKSGGAWSRAYDRPVYDWRYLPGAHASPSAPASNLLILRTETGRVFVDSAMVAYLRAEGPDEKVKVRRRKLVLLLTAPPQAKPATVTLTYLAKGIAWAPSYRVDISDPREISLSQSAVIKNELCDLADAEIHLITGFPNIQFANVVSPLSPRTGWAEFFQQLSTRFEAGHPSTRNVVAQQLVRDNERGPGGFDLSATPSGEGVDIHYQPVGRRTLKEGDALSFVVASGKAPYERIVEWIVADTRDAWGRPSQEDAQSNDAWDAVRFRNPLGFPMTTGAAAIVSGGRFSGQTLSLFVNAGEETTLRVTKALSVRTRSHEKEEEGGRQDAWIGGWQFRRVSVQGQVTVNNHRKEEIRLVVRRRFSGELVSAEGDPAKSLREEGVYSVNPRRELTWNLALKPGEEKTLAYRYTVLVRH